VKRAESLLTSFDFHIDFDAACDAPTFKGFCNEIVFGPFSFGSLVTPPPGKITANLHVNIYKNSPAANTNFSFDLPISLNALHFSRYKPNSDRKIAVLSEPVKPENLRNDGAFISLRDLYGATIVISAWGASCGERCDSEQTFKDIRNNFIPSKLRISLPDGEGIDIDKMVAEKGDYVFNVNAEGG
jgi:hypothetical protein